MFRTSVYGTCLILASTLVLARLCQAADPPVPVFGQAQFTFGEGPAPPVSLSTVGFSLVGRADRAPGCRNGGIHVPGQP